MHSTTAALLALSALAACATQDPHAAELADLQGSWQLDGPVPAGARIPTLSIGADGSLSGNGGVNRFRGALDRSALARGRFSAGQLVATRMAGTPAAMALEDGFLRALEQADHAVLAGEQLQLRRGDAPLLALVRARLR